MLERSLAFSAEELSQYEDPTAKALEAAGVPQERAEGAASAATAAVAEAEQRDESWEAAKQAADKEQERKRDEAQAQRAASPTDQTQERPVPPPRPRTSAHELTSTEGGGQSATTKPSKRSKKPNKFLAPPGSDFEPYDPREKFGPLSEPKPNLSVKALERARRGESKAPRPFSFEEREEERRRSRPTKLTQGAAMAAEKAAREEEHVMKAGKFRAKKVPDFVRKSVNLTSKAPMTMAEKVKEDEEKRQKLAMRQQARLQVKMRAEEIQSSNKPKPYNLVEWSHKRDGKLGVVFDRSNWADGPYVKKIHKHSPADKVVGLEVGCKLLSIEFQEVAMLDGQPVVTTSHQSVEGMSYEVAKTLLGMRPLKLSFAKGGWRAKPVPKACDLDSVGKLEQMAEADEQRKQKNRAKAEENYRNAAAPQLSPTKAKRSAKLRESVEKRHAAVAAEVAAEEGQNKENPFDQRWNGWMRSEGLVFEGERGRPAPLLSMRQLQRACRKVAGLPPLTGAEMEHALSEMTINSIITPHSNPDTGCITTEQAKKWVREQQHIMCWSRVQSSTAGLPVPAAAKVMADILADEHRLPETRWPNLGPRHKQPRNQFVEDRPKIVFETNAEVYHREILQMSEAERMEMARAQAELSVRVMQQGQGRGQQGSGADDGGAADWRQEVDDAIAAVAGSAQLHDATGHEEEEEEEEGLSYDPGAEQMDRLQEAAEADGAGDEAEQEEQEPVPFYVKAAEVVTKQRRTEEWVDSDDAAAAVAAAAGGGGGGSKGVTWNDEPKEPSEAEQNVDRSGGTAAAAAAAASTAASTAAVAAPPAAAAPTPGEKYLERKSAQDLQKEELLALEAQKARKRAARAQEKNELLRLAAELPVG